MQKWKYTAQIKIHQETESIKHPQPSFYRRPDLIQSLKTHQKKFSHPRPYQRR